MSQHLRRRLGSDHGVARHVCPDKKDVQQGAGDARRQVEARDGEAGQYRVGRAGGVQSQAIPGQPGEEGRQPQAQEEQGPGRRERKDEDQERSCCRAEAIPADHGPPDVAALDQGPPAVGGQLQNAVGHEGGLDGQDEGQHPH